MPHSAEFNRRRREAYREARRAGLRPREAGHFYWQPSDERFQARLNENFKREVKAPIKDLGSARERQIQAVQVGRDFFPVYTKTRIVTRDEDGKVQVRWFTIVSSVDKIPTYGELYERALEIMDKNISRYAGEELLSLSYTTVGRVTPGSERYVSVLERTR
jgi:hypothetical protein